MVVLAPLYMFGTPGTMPGHSRLRVGLCDVRLRGMGVACGPPRYVFGTLGRGRSVRNYVQGCIGGARGACGDPAYVFAAFFTMPGHSRLRVGLCDARLRGVGGACSDPPYVFGTLGTRSECSRLCAGLCEACVRAVDVACGVPSLCFRHPWDEDGASEIARGVK